MSFHAKPNQFVSHVRIHVENLERSLAYYQEVIGLRILQQTNHSAHLSANSQKCLLTLEQPEPVVPKQGRTTGLYHFALLLPDRVDLADTIQHLIEKDVPFGSSDHLVSEAIYLSDPDGNGIEIYTDRSPDLWSWKHDEVKMAVAPLDFKDLLASRKKSAWKGLPTGTVMGHIHLHVSDLSKAEIFYTQGLGYEVVNRFGDQALFLSTGKYHHHIALNTWNGAHAPPPPANSVGLTSFTVILADKEVQKETVTRLREIGAFVMEENQHYTAIDPSGNRIILEISG